jgi:phage-related protein
MTWKSFWNGFKKTIGAPFKLIGNIGKAVYNKVIKPVANFGSNAVKSVGNFVKDSANVILHMPEKVLHTVDHTVDKAGETLTGFFKSPMVLIAAIGGVILLPTLMKK